MGVQGYGWGQASPPVGGGSQPATCHVTIRSNPPSTRSHLNTARSSTQTVASVVPATVAVRGESYMSEISPKQSPRSFMLTRTV